MKEKKKYSLWLMPGGEVYHRLHTIIYQLSERYSTPVFEPHITLIGGLIETEQIMINKTSELATIIKPHSVKLTQVDSLEEFYRCLFIRVEETDEVMEAYSKVCEVFRQTDNTKYMPHLSLMYGNLTSEVKKEIIKQIGWKFTINFDVNSINLFSTHGLPKDWYRVKKVTLM